MPITKNDAWLVHLSATIPNDGVLAPASGSNIVPFATQVALRHSDLITRATVHWTLNHIVGSHSDNIKHGDKGCVIMVPLSGLLNFGVKITGAPDDLFTFGPVPLKLIEGAVIIVRTSEVEDAKSKLGQDKSERGHIKLVKGGEENLRTLFNTWVSLQKIPILRVIPHKEYGGINSFQMLSEGAVISGIELCHNLGLRNYVPAHWMTTLGLLERIIHAAWVCIKEASLTDESNIRELTLKSLRDSNQEHLGGINEMLYERLLRMKDLSGNALTVENWPIIDHEILERMMSSVHDDVRIDVGVSLKSFCDHNDLEAEKYIRLCDLAFRVCRGEGSLTQTQFSEHLASELDRRFPMSSASADVTAAGASGGAGAVVGMSASCPVGEKPLNLLASDIVLTTERSNKNRHYTSPEDADPYVREIRDALNMIQQETEGSLKETRTAGLLMLKEQLEQQLAVRLKATKLVKAAVGPVNKSLTTADQALLPDLDPGVLYEHNRHGGVSLVTAFSTTDAVSLRGVEGVPQYFDVLAVV